MGEQEVRDTANIYSGPSDDDTMGGRLSRARDRLGITTAQLARRIGVQTATLQAWETDRSQPRANRLSMLAGVLNVSLSWLLHGIGTGPEDDERAGIVADLAQQLQRLKRAQQESAEIIARLEAELRRMSEGRPQGW